MFSGSLAVLRIRQVADYIRQNEAQGVRIEYADGEVPGSIEQAMSESPFFGDSGERVLVVVENPHKGSLDLYRKHLGEKEPRVLLLLHYDGDPKGNTKFGKFAKELKSHKQFTEPSQWEALDEAVKFLQAEAKREHGKELDKAVASLIAQRAGTDFGVLVFELRKMALLADHDQSNVIERKHAVGAIAEIVEVDISLLMDTLRSRNRKAVAVILKLVRSRSRSDPTMHLCRLLGSEALKWLQAVSLEHVPPKAAASELGLNPWYFETKILPVAKSWGKENIIRLIHALADAERGVLSGHIDPWIGFSAGLLRACGPS